MTNEANGEASGKGPDLIRGLRSSTPVSVKGEPWGGLRLKKNFHGTASPKGDLLKKQFPDEEAAKKFRARCVGGDGKGW